MSAADEPQSSVQQTGVKETPSEDTGPFMEGEKVLAYHGPLIYEAKTQKAEFRKKEWRYYVHYLGWSKNWDEWVGIDRLMKHTETNLLKQKKLFKQNAEKKGTSKIGGGRGGSKSDGKDFAGAGQHGGGSKGRKRKTDSSTEERDGEEQDHTFKITLPSTLKKQLIEDWKQVTQEPKQLVRLPRDPCITEILDQYLELKTKRESGNDTWHEITTGLKAYFNRALAAMLLYESEREQYEKVMAEENEPPAPVDVYGAEHLLRLFVKLPELLKCTNMETEAMVHLQNKINDFLKFLQKHQTSFFLSNYDGNSKDE